jgi:hypothetical protein
VKIGRRTFLRLSGLVSSCVILFTVRIPSLFGGKWEHGEKEWWDGETFRQNNVKTDKIEERLLSAKIEDTWREYRIRDLSDGFCKWNFNSRIARLEEIKEMMEGEGMRPGYAGPHNGIVASYGGKRKDSEFTLNNAVKGMGFIPTKAKLKETITHLEETIDQPMKEKLDVLKKNYENQELFDTSKQVSLELYTEPSFETHTFLNQMENPLSTIVFLDIPSYELRCISQLLHPNNPSLTEYERDVVHYTNLVHSYFHGHFEKEFITVIYHVIEEFNNTPGKQKGMRTVPPRPLEPVEDMKKKK